MSEFVKTGNRIAPKPQGLDYNLISKKVYNLMWDDYTGVAYLEEDGLLNLPSKIYNTPEDASFIDRVCTHYRNTTKLTTGIMLGGTKGTGKTVMAKQIAYASELPIIVVNERFRSNRVNDFFKTFSTPVCIIFDEIEKNTRYWDTAELLGFLDGIQSTAKKMVLMTCNKISEVSEYFLDRCSRVRYYREFKNNDNERFIKSIIQDKGIVDTDSELYTFIVKGFKLLSIDNILAFLEEYLMFPDLSKTEVCHSMNITLNSTAVENSITTSDDNDDDEEVEERLETVLEDKIYDAA